MDLTALGLLFVIVLAGFAVAVALMTLGQRLTGRCMRGSCGGPGSSHRTASGCPAPTAPTATDT